MDLLNLAKVIFLISVPILLLTSGIIFSEIYRADYDWYLDEERPEKSLKQHITSVLFYGSLLGVGLSCILFAVHCYIEGLYLPSLFLILTLIYPIYTLFKSKD